MIRRSAKRSTKRSLAAAAVFAVAVSPAFASSCPKDMKQIDAALPNANVSAEVMSEIKSLRAKGEELHKAGQHKASVEALHKAKKLLGL